MHRFLWVKVGFVIQHIMEIVAKRMKEREQDTKLILLMSHFKILLSILWKLMKWSNAPDYQHLLSEEHPRKSGLKNSQEILSIFSSIPKESMSDWRPEE